MNTLLGIVRNIALLVLVSAFWEMLAPAGKLRSTVRLVMALLLISMIITPLTDIISRDAASWSVDLPEMADSADALAAGEQIAAQAEIAARSAYQEDLARQVASLCNLTEQVVETKVGLQLNPEQGQIERIYLEVTAAAGADTAALEDKLLNLISSFYGLAEINIECQIKEAVDDARAGAGTESETTSGTKFAAAAGAGS